MLYYEHDLTRKDVDDILSLRIPPNTKDWKHYETAKSILRPDWNDEIAKWTTQYIGV